MQLKLACTKTESKPVTNREGEIVWGWKTTFEQPKVSLTVLSDTPFVPGKIYTLMISESEPS